MKQQEYLEQWELILRARSPLFFGSGQKYLKHEYCYHPATQTVSVLNENAFFQLLIEQDKIDLYEQYIFGKRENLHQFLSNDCKFSPQELSAITKYQISASDALQEASPMKEISSFIRDAYGRAYIPGSSVKGAFRTALLTQMMDNQKKGNWPFEESPKKKNSYLMTKLEGEYLNTLALRRNRKTGQIENDSLNSIMRGIFISDSEPIPDTQMVLCGKIDVAIDGQKNSMNLCRECIKPGTEVHLTITLDQSILKGQITGKTIMETIADYGRLYQKRFTERFAVPAGAADISYQNALILGGGSGYFSKTLTYAYLGMEEGLQESANIMQQLFFKNSVHKHDMEIGISPHMMKYTQYNGKLYPFGVCEVILQ